MGVGQAAVEGVEPIARRAGGGALGYGFRSASGVRGGTFSATSTMY